eukprot:SAG25_NODE_137_length_14197_cov_30.387120_10_plen_84_part_00
MGGGAGLPEGGACARYGGGGAAAAGDAAQQPRDGAAAAGAVQRGRGRVHGGAVPGAHQLQGAVQVRGGLPSHPKQLAVQRGQI